MRFLLIEDDPDHAYFIKDAIHDGYKKNIVIDWHTEIQAGLNNLQIRDYDIVLCDLQLPDSNIDATVNHLLSLEIDTPIIVLTSLNDQETAKSLICQGIQDYLPKEDLGGDLLRRVCTHAIERKKQTVLLQNKNRDQASFCYSLSNDFKTPIRRINSFVEVLREDLEKRLELNDDNKICFDGIQRNIHSINTMISGLVDYLNLEIVSDDFDEIDLNTAIEEVKGVFPLDRDGHASIVYNSLPIIEANRGQILLLLKNIIENGIKFNANVPVISITSDIDDDKKRCTLSVVDNGIGIDDENINKIFDPFFRVPNSQVEEGPGLGLSIAKRIVDCHGGDIEASSANGGGSVFKVTLPLFQNVSAESVD